MDWDGVIMRNSVLILTRIDRIISVISIHPQSSYANTIFTPPVAIVNNSLVLSWVHSHSGICEAFPCCFGSVLSSSERRTFMDAWMTARTSI